MQFVIKDYITLAKSIDFRRTSSDTIPTHTIRNYIFVRCMPSETGSQKGHSEKESIDFQRRSSETGVFDSSADENFF
jgi:hypothetical protein